MQGRRPRPDGNRPKQTETPPTGHTTIGQVVGPHGVKGGLRVTILTDFPERFDAGQTVFIHNQPRKIIRATYHKDQVRLDLEQINTREQAENLKWAILTVPEDEIPDLDEDQFLVRDLIGLTAVTTDGKILGPVQDVLPNPAHDIIIVAGAMVPAVKEFVKEIDLKNRTMTLKLIPGMLPEDPTHPDDLIPDTTTDDQPD